MPRLFFLLPVVLCVSGNVFAQVPPTAVPFLPPSSQQNPPPTIVPVTKVHANVAVPPSPVQPAPPVMHHFDPKHVEVRRIDQRWVLVADNVLLRDFGMREADAREAKHVIQALHLNQVGTIGSPQPAWEFWLSDGHAPLPTVQGLHTLPLNLNNLRVQHFNNSWVVWDATDKASHVLGSFGEHRELAFQALDLIRLYGFNQQGVIGSPMPSMTYYLGNPMEKARWDAGQIPGNQISSPQAKPTTTAPVVQAITAERLHFEASHVEVREDNHQWQLVVGKQVLANFGPEHYLAKQAQQVMQYYRFSDKVTIGTPENGFHYFLANGQPPVGVRFGVQMQLLHPESLTVRQLGNRWLVCDGANPVKDFDQRIADAKEFVRVVQQYHFDRLCCVGNMNGQGITFLVKSR